MGPLYLTRNDKKYVAAYLSNAKDFGHRDSPQLRRAAYREDLKFLRKYGLKRMAKTAVHSDLDEKAIIREIQRVIQDIDDHAKRKQSGSHCNDGGGGVDDEHKSNDDNDGRRHNSTSRRRRGSTKMIQEEDDLEMKDIMDAQDMTPPLSEVEEEDEDEVIDTESNSKPQMTRKRTFADLQEHGTPDAVDDDDYNAKRMKSNLGDAVPVIKTPVILRRQLTDHAASDGVTE